MILVLDIATSLEFWRKIYPPDRTPQDPCDLPDDCVAHMYDEIQSLVPQWVSRCTDTADGKLHVMAFDHPARKTRSRYVVHAWTTSVPRWSFYALGNDVYIASPEFIALCSASFLSRPALIALCDELCGLYGFDSTAARGFRTRMTPLLDKKALERYIDSSRGLPGNQRLRKALAHVVEESASPMETLDEMLLCLPYKLGGYGIPQPLMNHPIVLNPKAARIAHRAKCIADMYWDAARLDVEHHGMLYHSTEKDGLSDRARVNALQEMGLEVIELTAPQVYDAVTFESIAIRIAKLTHHRIRKEHLGIDGARNTLRETLFEWNKTYGAVRNASFRRC